MFNTILSKLNDKNFTSSLGFWYFIFKKICLNNISTNEILEKYPIYLICAIIIYASTSFIHDSIPKLFLPVIPIIYICSISNKIISSVIILTNSYDYNIICDFCNIIITKITIQLHNKEIIYILGCFIGLISKPLKLNFYFVELLIKVFMGYFSTFFICQIIPQYFLPVISILYIFSIIYKIRCFIYNKDPN